MRILVPVLIFILTACNSNEPRIPNDIIDESEMISIIKDIELMEAVHKDIGQFGTKKREMSDTSFAIIFKEHGVRPSAFDSSMRFYSNHPKIMERIMLSVENELNKEL